MKNRLFACTMLAFSFAALTACGTTDVERGATGAGLGGAAGYAVGAPLLGAAAGGAAGVFTDPEDVNLGEPIWDWDL